MTWKYCVMLNIQIHKFTMFECVLCNEMNNIFHLPNQNSGLHLRSNCCSIDIHSLAFSF